MRWSFPLALVVLAVVADVGRAQPSDGPRSRLGAAAEGALRKALGPHLSPAEIERLLRDDRALLALTPLFEGWDGVGDELAVGKRGDAIVVATTLRDRHCAARLELGPEVAPSEPICDEHLRDGGRVAIDDDLWRAPARTPPRAPPKPPAVAAVVTQPEAPEPVGPVDNTVLRRAPSPGSIELGEIALVRAEHERLKDRLRAPHWKDPLLPADAIEAGEALRPLDPPAPVVEKNVDANLRNPFDEARMRTQDPVPWGLTLPHDEGPMKLPPMREGCVDELRLGTGTPLPPTLDCYRRASWNGRLEDDPLYQALLPFATWLKLPIVDLIATTIVGAKVDDAVSHKAHRVVWALVWLGWVKDHPDRTAEALERLTIDERRFVRRRLADWWVENRLAGLRPIITRLFERHLTGLYPESRDLDGLPRRAFVTDTWLWANNWLAVLDAREPDAIAAAYERLSAPERRVIKAFVRDSELARRWSHAAEVIAAL